MGKNSLAAVLIIIFLLLSFASILRFTALEKAKWFDDGADLAYGIITIYLGSLLFRAYRATKNKHILTVAMGFFILAFVRVLEIHIQELQIATNYIPPQTLLWEASYLITFSGALLIAKGIWSAVR